MRYRSPSSGRAVSLIRLGPAPVSSMADTGLNTVAETPTVAETL
mgnify:CR=1 FL=1